MFVINDDLTIDCTRGDIGDFSVGATINGTNYVFKPGDVVRFTVCAKKDYSKVVLQKDVKVAAESETVTFQLDSEDTKIGGVINKPTEYWYTVELNPDTSCQTIIGHTKDGARVITLYPEADSEVR